MNRPKLILLLIWPILAAAGSFWLHAGVLTSILLFFAAPSVYLAWFKRSAVAKSALFAVIMAIPVGTIADYVMEHTRGWFLPSSAFGSFRLFGYVTLEQHIWLFFYVFFMLIFYETFLERYPDTNRLYAPKLKYLALIFFGILGVFLMVLTVRGSLLHIPYFYLQLGILGAGIPITFAIFRLPGLLGKMLKVGLYFFVLSFVYEITALKLGQWIFPAENQFIGMVHVFGVRFPIEELIFWMMLGPLAAISYYEFFDDDQK